MIKAFSKLLNNKGLFRNITGTIEQAVVRGSRSKHLTEESVSLVGGIRQVFQKGDNIVVKHYRPSKGTIDTAFFTGNKAKLIRQDGYFEGITQPDKLVSQVWDNGLFNSHCVDITKPLEKLNNVELARGIHKPQITTSLQAFSDGGAISYSKSSYPSRISSGLWGSGVTKV